MPRRTTSLGRAPLMSRASNAMRPRWIGTIREIERRALAGVHLEAHVFEGLHAAVPDREILDREQRRAGGGAHASSPR